VWLSSDAQARPILRSVGRVDYSLVARFVQAQRRNSDARSHRVKRKDVDQLLVRITERRQPSNVHVLERDDR
jgi:hypothetical protein